MSNDIVTNSDVIWYRVAKTQHKTNEEMIRRIKKIYSHQHGVSNSPPSCHVAEVMLSFVLKMNTPRPVSLIAFANELHPTNFWKWGGGTQFDYWDTIILWCARHIRDTNVEYIPNYVAPVRYRNKSATWQLQHLSK